MRKRLLVILPILIIATTILIRHVKANISEDSYAYGENIGWLTMGGSYDGTYYGVVVSDDCLSGFIWQENVGWINLGDANCADREWGVDNDGFGNLTGYAWGENIGWINFDDTSENNYNQVTINLETGEFQGYAWGENVGWISFSCDNQDTCATVNYGPTADLSQFSIGGGQELNISDETTILDN